MYKAIRLFHYKDGLQLEQEALEGVCQVEECVCTTEDEIIARCQDADILMSIFEPLTARVLQALPKLQLISCKSMGFNYVDLEAARTQGISVTHLQGYCVEEVADYVCACILSHNKRLFEFDRSVRQDKKWDFTVCPDIRRLSTQTVGLAGFGRIARLVARRLQPFGVRILAADPYVDPAVADDYSVSMVSMEELFRSSDYISMHIPLSKETENLVDWSLFDLIPDHTVFINAARGGIVREVDLCRALDSGKIFAAYLDVLADEYPDMHTHPLANRKNVVLTPHVAFYSQESGRSGRLQCCQNIKNFIHQKYSECIFVPGGNNTAR